MSFLHTFQQGRPMKKLTKLGLVAPSAGFRSNLRDGDELVYLKEARLLREQDPDAELFTGFAFAIDDNEAVFKETCDGLREMKFTNLRGIVMGGPETSLSDPDVQKTARANLVKKLGYAVDQGITRVFTVSQEWPAGDTGADFHKVVAPTIAGNAAHGLSEVPGITEFSIEFLIKAEQEHMNCIARNRLVVRMVNNLIQAQRAFNLPDLAHLLGLVPREFWPDVLAQLADACLAGEVRYGHLSIPETRTDNIEVAIAVDELEEAFGLFCKAIGLSPEDVDMDLEAFNPNDQDLGPLRDNVKRFASADPSGWTEGKRFARFNRSGKMFRDQFASING